MDFAFPQYPLRQTEIDGKSFVWDAIRKKWLLMAGEEYVRQQLIQYLIQDKNISPGLIAIEKEIRYGDLRKRFDLVVYRNDGKPFILCECKAPNVKITQNTILQISRYNRSVEAPHWLITNGLSIFMFSRDKDGKYQFQTEGWIREI